jgi:hypothetical protein
MLDFLLNIAIFPVLGLLAWGIYYLLCERQKDNAKEYTGYPHDRGIPYHGPNCPNDPGSPSCG